MNSRGHFHPHPPLILVSYAMHTFMVTTVGHLYYDSNNQHSMISFMGAMELFLSVGCMLTAYHRLCSLE